MKKLAIGLICVMVAAVLGLTAILVVGIQMGGFPAMGIDMDEKNLANRQVFSASEIKALAVSYRSDSVTVYPAGGDDVVLEEYFSQWDEGTLATCTQDGGSLVITGGQRAPQLFFRSEIRLYIPPKWAADVKLDTSSGSIRSDVFMQFASLSAASNSGSVRLGDVDAGSGEVLLAAKSGSVHAGSVAGGAVVLNSISGSIRVDSVKGENVVATCASGGITVGALQGQFALESKSGGMHVENCAGSGSAKSSSGSVNVAFSALTGPLAAESTSGSVRISLPAGTGVDFSAKTSSGSIRTNFKDRLFYSEDGKTATGTIGEEPRYAVRCQASSGSVHVDIG